MKFPYEEDLLDSYLLTYFIGELHNAEGWTVKRTSNNIWGKEVIVYKDLELVYRKNLETWVVDVNAPRPGMDLDLYVSEVQGALIEEEEKRVPNRDLGNYTMYQLLEWRIKEHDHFTAIKNGKVSFVKYAIILEDVK